MTGVLILAVVVALLLLRRRRRSNLAGLNSAKPTFSIAPPTRWSTTGKDHRL